MGGKNQLSTFARFRTQPIIRTVYMEIGEVPRPHVNPVALLRSPDHTTIRIHPGTPTPPGIEKIVRQLEDNEVPGWAWPWLGRSVDLRTIIRDPLGALSQIAPTLLHVPATPHVIPLQQRAPWVIYQ